MKIREMFTKVNKFNAMAEELGIEERKAIRFEDNDCSLVRGTFKSYTDFMKMIKEEYIDECVKEIQTRDDFILNGDTKYETVLWEGTTFEWRNTTSYYIAVVDENY